MKQFFLLIVIIGLLSTSANLITQSRNIKKQNLEMLREQFYTNVITLPAKTDDSIRIILAYTFFFKNLVFMHNNEVGFFATPELEMVFRDNDGIIRNRFLSKDTIFATTFDETQSKTLTTTCFAELTMPNKDYRINAKLNNSKSIFPFTTEQNIKQSETNFDIVFLQKSKELNTYYPVLLNNKVPFVPCDISFFVPLTTTSQDSTFKFTITKKTVDTDLDWGDVEPIMGVCKIKTSYEVETLYDDNKVKIIISDNNDNQNKLLYSDFSTAKLWPGKYVLSIDMSPDSAITIDFEVKWYDIPASLIITELAADHLYLLLTDSEYKQLKNGNTRDIFKNILSFWNDKDPTPMTAFNEAMDTFFRRVDYAEEEFQTLTEKNGATSDRGKIYILNGPPDDIITSVNQKKSFEQWTYKKTNQNYLFEIVSVGNYKLIKVEK